MIAGVPMTAKQIADKIGISASSVQHHIRLLAELGIVEQSHIEQITGSKQRIIVPCKRRFASAS
jgi:predicted ArsR family transcriptional regulator